MTPANRVILVLASRGDPGQPAGGIHKAVLGQIAALQAKQVRVVLLTASEACARDATAMGAEVDFSPAWHHSIKPMLYPAMLLKLLQLRFSGVQCIIHHSGRTWFWGHLLFAGIPQVQVFHRELVRPYRFFRRWLALSPGYAEVLRCCHSLAGLRKVAWAPNGLIEIPDPPPLPLDHEQFTLGFIGRAGPGKGTDLLLAATAALVNEGMRLRLRFAGEGRELIEAEANRHGIPTHVEWTGSHHDLAPFIDSIDLLVLPSHKESFGLVIIECMARGKAVLATACHGPASIIEHGRTGILAPIDDVDALADAIRNAASDPERLREIGAAGHRRVMQEYIPQAVGAKLLRALVELGMSHEEK